jgi:hypothetical protein
VTVETTRARFGSVLEWVIAAACILLALGIGSMMLREVQTFRPVTPVNAEAARIPEAPANVPPRAVSVPMLLLSNGTQLHIGERASTIAAKLPTAWQSGSDALERGANGPRVTRSYDDGRTQFTLVFESPEDGAEQRVAAIYLR